MQDLKQKRTLASGTFASFLHVEVSRRSCSHAVHCLLNADFLAESFLFVCKGRFWLAALRRNPAVAEFLPKRFRRDQGL